MKHTANENITYIYTIRVTSGNVKLTAVYHSATYTPALVQPQPNKCRTRTSPIPKHCAIRTTQKLRPSFVSICKPRAKRPLSLILSYLVCLIWFGLVDTCPLVPQSLSPYYIWYYYFSDHPFFIWLAPFTSSIPIPVTMSPSFCFPSKSVSTPFLLISQAVSECMPVTCRSVWNAHHHHNTHTRNNAMGRSNTHTQNTQFN